MTRVVLAGLAFWLLLLPGTVQAQTLDPAQFQNTWSWVLDDTFDSNDTTTPERADFSGSAGAAGYGLTWDVSYGPSSSPPEVTANAEVTFGGSGESTLFGSAGSEIYFQIRVVETAPPPNQITTVPVTFVAHGTVETSGGDPSLYAQSQASFQVGPDASPVILRVAFANINVPSSAFNVDEVQGLTVGAVIECRMGVSVFGSASSPGAAGTQSTSAFVDPVIEILDTPIPTTNQSYRDFYAIEFSPGYSDLTPVRQTTWGSLKRMYGQGK